jgi:hypothetical protein
MPGSLPLEDGKRVAAIHVEAGDLIIERRVDIRGPHDGGPYPVFTGRLTVKTSAETSVASTWTFELAFQTAMTVP